VQAYSLDNKIRATLIYNDLALHGTQFLVFSKNSSHTMLFQEKVFALYKPIRIKIA